MSLNKAISRLNLDTSHFTGQGWNKNNFVPARPIEDYLSNKYPAHSHRLRLRLIKEKILEPICVICKSQTWNGSPIPLELDHVNGKHEDNTLENLRLLCPNCHAQTSNYRGRAKSKSKSKA
jgi:5-methylcytosine-specific restriction endonuclease McrA